MEQDSAANQTLGLQVIPQQGSTLTRMKKMISSPRARRRNNAQASSSGGKIFGSSLEDILKRYPSNHDIPFIVERICQYIERNGLDQEGIFRVNGNMKILEKLKNSFEKYGDAELEEAGDIMAVAGLLKLFLRQLADPVIPEDVHPIFIQAHRDCRDDKPFYMKIIQDLIYRIPNPNYALLKYLCNFLVTVSKKSEVNKMTPIALAIVFGPNLFRCCEGLEGLSEQAHVNAIVALFIDEYEQLFQERGNFFSFSNSSQDSRPGLHSSLSEGDSPKKQKPARPPPPKFRHSLSAPASSVSPLFSPPDEAEYEQIDGHRRKFGVLDTVDENLASLPVEPTRSLSPSVSFLVPESEGKKMVETTIRDAVKEHLFGPSFLTSSTESDTQIAERAGSPDVNGHPTLSVREKVKRLNAASSIEDTTTTAGKKERSTSAPKGKKRPKTSPWELAEGKGGPVVFQGKEHMVQHLTSGSGNSIHANEKSKHFKVGLSCEKPSCSQESRESASVSTDSSCVDNDPLQYIQDQSCEPLKSLTANRAPLPKNRRRPSSIAVSSPSDYGNSQMLYRVPRDKEIGKGASKSVQLFYDGENHWNSTPNIGEAPGQSTHVVINKKGMVSRTPRGSTEDSNDDINSPTSSVTTAESLESVRSSSKHSKELMNPKLSEHVEAKLHVKVSKQRKSRSVENLLDVSSDGHHERTRSLSPVNDGRASVRSVQLPASPTSSIYTREVTPLRPLSPLTVDTTNILAGRGRPVSPVKSPRKSAGNLPAGSKHGLLTTVSQDNKSPTPAKREPVERKALSCVDKFKRHCRDQPVVPPLDLYRLQKEDDIEEPQPSPRARFDRVYNDGPVRSPRSPSMSQVEFDVQYDSPPDPPNHHRNVDWLEKRQESVPILEMSPKELKRRIEALKKIVGNFEAAFVDRHGRRPKSSEKAPVQKYMAELGRAKKQLREMMEDLKEFPDLLNEVNTQPEGLTAPNLRDIQVRDAKPTKEDTLNGLLKKLQDKRWAAGRPEEIGVMTSDQLADEKLAVQKALLQYESVHGRPSTKEDKNLMRPLYERYRKIKRLIANETITMPGPSTTEKSERKFSDSRDRNSKDLEPILEGVQLHDFRENENHTSPSAIGDEVVARLQDGNDYTLNDTFSVTARVPEQRTDGDTNSGSNGSLDEAVLHEASLEELLEQQKLAKKQKKKLGKTLKNFEENFYAETGRKVQKEDRLPMETEYRDYKLIKARLRLLEALISKMDANKTV